MTTKAEGMSEEVREKEERDTMDDTHGGGSGETPTADEGGDGSLTLTHGHALLRPLTSSGRLVHIQVVNIYMMKRVLTGPGESR